jgi:hypothetical protein
MSRIFTKSYNGASITFDDTLANVTFVNATEMGRPFYKNPSDWLELQATKDFLSALEDARKLTFDFCAMKTGVQNETSKEQSLWFDETVAVEFARWLSPAFGIWCSDTIKEIVNGSHYVFTLFDIPKTFSEALSVAAEQAEFIEQARKENSKEEQARIWGEFVKGPRIEGGVVDVANKMAEGYYALSHKSSEEDIDNVARLILETRKAVFGSQDDTDTSLVVKQCDLFELGIEKLREDIKKAKDAVSEPEDADA